MNPIISNQSLPLEQMVGQMILAGFKGKTVSENSEITQLIDSFNIGGVILYDMEMTQKPPGKRNIDSPDQLRQLTQNLQSFSKTPMFIATDQEGGNCARLTSEYGFSHFSSWKEIGELNDLEKTRSFSYLVADTLHQGGINLNLAPVLDIQNSSDSMIGSEGRCISGNYNEVIDQSRVFIEEHRKKQIGTVGKHFPGQGSAVQDAHSEMTDISDTWDESELIPYSKLIQSKDINAIMVGHVFIRSLDKDYPASLSKKIICDLLRKKMGFNGVVICDDPVMKAISDHYSWGQIFELMINAGVDLICLGNNLEPYRENLIIDSIKTIVSQVKNGKIPMIRIKESFQRILNLKSNLF